MPVLEEVFQRALVIVKLQPTLPQGPSAISITAVMDKRCFIWLLQADCQVRNVKYYSLFAGS